jgi:chromosome segregation ATPase
MWRFDMSTETKYFNEVLTEAVLRLSAMLVEQFDENDRLKETLANTDVLDKNRQDNWVLLQQEVEACHSEIARLKELVCDFGEQHTKNQQEIIALEQQNGMLQQQWSDDWNRIKALRTVLNEEEVKREAAEAREKRTQQNFDELESNYDHLNTSYEELSEEYRRYVDKYELLQHGHEMNKQRGDRWFNRAVELAEQRRQLEDSNEFLTDLIIALMEVDDE